MASALDSLTATYTDSEGEEEKIRSDDDDDEVSSLAARQMNVDKGGTPGSGHSSSKMTRLVSYNDPDVGPSDENRESVPMDLESDDEDKTESETNGVKEKEEHSHIMEQLWEGGVKLPPEPTGSCSREIQEKIEKMWRRKVDDRVDMNYAIQNNKAFRNPSIYEKLVKHLNIDELGTNFPPELYDGHLFGKDSYYDELGKQQKTEMDKREKAAEQKRKLGDTAVKDAISTIQQRKSKWDQGASAHPTNGSLPGLLTATTLGKVIPAIGSLKKK